MVYLNLLNKKEVGVRELKNLLSFSSPSVAKYHLEKLCELNLVENRNGRYYLIAKADLPMLSAWIILGKYLFPKALFFFTFFLLTFLGYLFFIYNSWNRDSIFTIIFGIIILTYLGLDLLDKYKTKPF